MELLRNKSFLKFDRQFPVYNFFFPNPRKNPSDRPISEIFDRANKLAKSRALYFHIPFCDTICNFCPFSRGLYKDRDIIDRYFDALILEIKRKAESFRLYEVPVRAIFFGGGTPSLLDAKQIDIIGRTIKDNFDLSVLEEFSFEVEVKSLTVEKADAMRSIGVSHPRFGLQTLDPYWRDMFDLTASLDQIYTATDLLKSRFPYQSFDLLYGMSGHDEDALLADLQKAVDLGTTNIDIYPIDNIVTQITLHKKLQEQGKQPTSALRKMSMTVLVDRFMRSAGFSPHNGHGYYRTPCDESTLVSNEYSFVYHEHVYGYADHDLVGFGTNAISSVNGHTIVNTSRKSAYIDAIQSGSYECFISTHDGSLDHARPVVLRLPYHGVIEKKLVNWGQVPSSVLERLKELVEERLVVETSTTYEVSKLGMFWYVNMMYYLMPKEDQKIMNRMVVDHLKQPGRTFTKIELVY